MCWYTLLQLGLCLLSETIGPRIVSGPENQTVVLEVDEPNSYSPGFFH